MRAGQSGEKTVEQLCREHAIARPTYCGWSEPGVKRLRELETENAQLKRILAEREVELDFVKEYLQKK